MKGIKRLRWLLAALLVGLAFTAQAQCTFSALSTAPAGPINVPASAAANEVLAVIQLNYSFSCTSGANTGYTLGPPGFGNIVISGPTNVSWNGSASGGKGPSNGAITSLTGPCTSITTTGTLRPSLLFPTGGTCAGTAYHRITLLATAAGPVSGNLPAALTPSGNYMPGWVNSVPCTSYPACGGGGNASATGSLSGPIALSPLSSTCTLSSAASMTVALPTVFTQAFNGIGSTTGTTPFTLSVNCPMASATALQLSVLYLSVNGNGTTSPAYVSNTAASPAGGVNVVLTDIANTAIVSGSKLLVTNAISAGLNAIQLQASYQQTAATVTPGGVRGVATYAFIYQ